MKLNEVTFKEFMALGKVIARYRDKMDDEVSIEEMAEVAEVFQAWSEALEDTSAGLIMKIMERKGQGENQTKTPAHYN